jgi:hypothetical protein
VDVEKQGIHARAGRADIVDRAVAGAEARPGLLPQVARFEALERGAGLHDRDDQHRRRAAHRAADPEQLAGAGAVEQDAERGDVSLRPDLLLLDDDARDHAVERRFRQARRLREGAVVGLGPQRLPALELRLPPALEAGLLAVLGGDVDLDPGHLEGAGAVDRRHAAVRPFELRPDRAAQRERGERRDDEGDAGDGLHEAPFGELGVEIQARYG